MTDLAERPITTEPDEPPAPARPATRLRVAQVLAFVALLSALVGALGPAERLRTTYSWPPATLPEATPERTWYAPLLLIRHRPETVTARIPCTLPAALPSAAAPTTVLATARSPEYVEGLAVRAQGGNLSLSVGQQVLTRAPLATEPTPSECAYDLTVTQAAWSLTGGPSDVTLGGELDAPAKVTGLFSSLDLRSGTPPSIDVTTVVHQTRPVTRQAVAWTLAFLAIAAALLLVAFERVPRKPWAAVARAFRGAKARAHAADAVVFGVLLGWWVLSPAFWDDGWILERVEMYSTSGGFSNYYSGFGVNLPSDYWLEWGQHLLVDISRMLIFLRLPALLALGVTWVLCRWILARVLGGGGSEPGVAVWALASAFLVGALAWGMTMRPEPVIALLATAVMACMVRFTERESAWPVAATAFLVPLALTGHHSGVVALAPVLVCTPRLVAWARSNIAAASALVTTTIASGLVLLFVGADFEQRREDTLIHKAGAANWRDELERYELLGQFPSGTPLRRATVALMGLVLVVWLLRRRGAGGLRTFPAATLTAALLLFILTPSKWPWHFGALIGIAAVAVAAETARFREDAPGRHGSRVVPLLAVGLAVVAAAWSWWPRTAWNPADLRTLDWTLGFESWFPLVPLATFLPLIVLGVVLVRGRGRVPRPTVASSAHRVGGWTATLVAVPLIAFTVGVLVVDAVRSEPWTLTRQNVDTLVSDPNCGLGDDLVTTDRSTLQPLAVAQATNGRSPSWVPPPPVEGLDRFALAPAAGGFGASAWFALPSTSESSLERDERRRVGLYVAGTPSPTDLLSLEWGRVEGGRVVGLGSDEIEAGFVSDDGAGIVSWRLLSAAELAEPRQGADVVRVTLRSDRNLASAVAVTGPVTYGNHTLAQQLQPSSSVSLVVPKLLTYFPCVRQPVLQGGTVGVPTHIVASEDFGLIWPIGHNASSPFNGIVDLYRLEHLPLADSRNPPHDVFAYEVVRDIPGAVEVLPAARTWSS